MKKQLLLLTVIATLPYLVMAQSPGGVGLPAIWLKADAGVSPTTIGSDITQWVNQGSINFTLTAPAGAAPQYQDNGKPSVYFSGNTKFLQYDQTVDELSSVLGDGNTSMRYDVFIVATGSTSGALLYMGPNTPGLAGAQPSDLNHLAFGKRAVYYNQNTTASNSYSDAEAGYYGAVKDTYAPNVPTSGIPNELTITNIGSSPVSSYIDINSLVFSINGYGETKDINGNGTSSGSRPYYGKERSYSAGNNGNRYDKLNVTKVLLGGVVDPASTTALKRYFSGNYYEIIVYNRLLSTEERQKVYSYLAAKYGIYLTHDQGAYSVTTPAIGESVGNGETVNNGTFFASDGTIFFKRDTYNYTDNTDYQEASATNFIKDIYYLYQNQTPMIISSL